MEVKLPCGGRRRRVNFIPHTIPYGFRNEARLKQDLIVIVQPGLLRVRFFLLLQRLILLCADAVRLLA